MLLTDTVGFIQRLPTRLIKAFRGTLEEALAADVVIHVVDLANKNYNRQISVVEETLLEIGAGRRPMVTALNKCDAASIPDVHEFPNAVATSSITGEGLKELLNRLDEIERARSLDIEVELPYSAGNLAALFHDRGHVAFESFGPNGTRLKGKIPSMLLDRFGPYRI
jgi:GTP-binding protein HflX